MYAIWLLTANKTSENNNDTIYKLEGAGGGEEV